MNRVDVKDLLGGSMVLTFGLFLVWHAIGYQLGTASRMGAGYFPALLGGICAALGFLMVVLSFRGGGELPQIAWRPLLAVLSGILCFILALRSLGLLPAIMLTVAVSSVGDREFRPLSTALLAVGCAAASWLIFRVGLNLPLSMFRFPI